MSSDSETHDMPLLDASKRINAHELSIALARNNVQNQEVGAF